MTLDRGERVESSEALEILSDILLRDESLDEILAKVVDLAARAIAGTDSASITTLIHDVAKTSAATSSLALRADEKQYEVGRGPCIDAAMAQQSILVPDMRADDRWPDYAIRAVGEGVMSSLSVPLPVQDRAMAALNLYSETSDAFDRGAREFAEEFAHRAGVAVANARSYADIEQSAAQLAVAMRSRAAIEQAKGALMAQGHCGPEDAFDILVRASQRENVKLKDIAARIVANLQRSAP